MQFFFGFTPMTRLIFALCSGVPGVKPERFEEGMKIRHCALSLVGKQQFQILALHDSYAKGSAYMYKFCSQYYSTQALIGQ